MSEKRTPTRMLVTPADGGWQVMRDGASRATAVYATQAEATRAAEAALRTQGGEMRVQGRDGRWRETFTLGEKAMTKVAAVEGIRFTPAMKRKARALEQPGLTDDDRRRILREPASKIRS